MRTDKYLADVTGLSRREAGEALRRGRVMVNGQIVFRPEEKLDERTALVLLDGEPLSYRRFTYILLYKPQGYVSSTDDPGGPTVLELLPENLRKGLFPCGRLDKNTTGLLLLTDDGALTHRLLSPKSHVRKEYRVVLERPVTEEDVRELEQGVDIGGYRTKPCVLKMLSPVEGIITLTEGKYHQIKRMFQNRCNRVIALERISFGGVRLDERLAPGEFRFLTKEEEVLLGAEN